MKVLDLQCSQGHRFEGWFASSDDFDTQLGGGLVECPLCADRKVVRMPSAPRLNLGSAAPIETQPATPAGGAPEARMLRAMRQLLADTEDVGTAFSEEARRIHHGEAPERGIRGHATPEEARALRDEGIPVFALPVPAALKETLQ